MGIIGIKTKRLVWVNFIVYGLGLVILTILLLRSIFVEEWTFRIPREFLIAFSIFGIISIPIEPIRAVKRFKKIDDTAVVLINDNQIIGENTSFDLASYPETEITLTGTSTKSHRYSISIVNDHNNSQLVISADYNWSLTMEEFKKALPESANIQLRAFNKPI
ncbi:hypothetical protein A28LD_1134 [Idiomarina sp. A28L]|uniref:hypothetical protein n=1 Tax=Idiomarina sp. A28L TaxID=1036674 RepID=UPI0002138DC9|nr:hypothetical protein [Idiomarina sp. A28L]EGN75521.1 hypothetical protein A28LD_1134 [Idiomarina sp. A28L]